MQIKRLQKFMSVKSGNLIKVTKITKSFNGDSKLDQCRICDVVFGQTQFDSARVVCADSIRRKYFKV